jgi:ComF family protein
LISGLQKYTEYLLQLFFPHCCIGCAAALADTDLLCIQCMQQLPATGFFEHEHNPAEKMFYGRLPVQSAAAAYFFTKDSLIQKLIFELKYKNNKAAGIYLGKLTGHLLLSSPRFQPIDVLIPVPLHPSKKRKRGYNQAELICQGMAAIIQKPILTQTVIRSHSTGTQTRQDRIHRWQNMENVFRVMDETAIAGKHILLVDDVITTGATLEACGREILQVTNTQLSIAAVAYTF